MAFKKSSDRSFIKIFIDKEMKNAIVLLNHWSG